MARAPDLHKWRRGYPAYFFILSSIMATENRSESTACAQQTNSQVQNGTAGNNEQQNGQPQQQQQQGSIWKGLLFRMFIFWMISNLFRGRQQSSNTNTVASTNMFKTDQKIVSLTYMFLQRWLLGFFIWKDLLICLIRCVYWRLSVDFLLKTGIFIPKLTTYRSKENTTFLFV